MKTLIRKPEKRKNYLFFNTTWDIWEAKKQIGTYAGFPFNYDEFRFVTLLGIAGNGLCTLDADIKSFNDLVGKKAIFDSGRGKGREMAYGGVLKSGGGYRWIKLNSNMLPARLPLIISEMGW